MEFGNLPLSMQNLNDSTCNSGSNDLKRLDNMICFELSVLILWSQTKKVCSEKEKKKEANFFKHKFYTYTKTSRIFLQLLIWKMWENTGKRWH